MRRVRLDRPVSPGATLARDVTGSAGEVIARAGHALNAGTLRALEVRGVTWCYVDDRWSEQIAMTPLDGGRASVRPLLREFEQRLEDVVAPLLTLSTQRALDVMRRTSPTAPLTRGRFIDDLPGAVQVFMEACADASADGGFLIDRGAAGDDIGHAIGVAAVTSRLVATLGLDPAEQAAIVSAALVHDVGMVLVPRSVRATPRDQRTVPERVRYEDHAVFGEVILEPFAMPSMHLSIVAGEHHEAADGSGYPRHRLGGHRLLRAAEEKRDVNRITLASEIVAVADLYERAVSPSPGFMGRSPAAASVVIEGAAGSSLNREIVHRLLASYPVLPLGTEVTISGGPHAGMQGLVIRLAESDSDLPVLLLYLDELGRPLDVPIELDLAHEQDAAVEVADAV